MALLLVDVHRAAEHEHGVELLVRKPALLGHVPLDQLVTGLLDHVAEDPARPVGLVDHREDAHAPSLRKTLRRSAVG